MDNLKETNKAGNSQAISIERLIVFDIFKFDNAYVNEMQQYKTSENIMG